MELYIHIPFCIRKCAYCDFLSGPADHKTQDRYMTALLEEVRMAGGVHRQGGLANEKVDTIFIGGGTPSAVSAGWIDRLMDQVRRSFCVADDAEITMEANPGTLTAEKLAQYRRAGINRLSMGLQSTDDRELARLGRIHTYEEFLDNYRLAREAGFTNINIDLMSALPGQTEASYEQTLRRVLALEPEHISAYSLIIEEGTPFGQRYGAISGEAAEQNISAGCLDGETQEAAQWQLPTEEQDRQMYHRTKALLEEAGYERYEISNYARPGFMCRHNVGYWTRISYLGLGLGAASYYGGQRFSNTRNMKEYLAALEHRALEGGEVVLASDPVRILGLLRQEVQTLTIQDAMEEFMFLGLRLTKGISAADFETSFGQNIEAVYGSVLKRLTEQDLLERTYHGWRFTEWGLDVSNHVLAEFLF